MFLYAFPLICLFSGLGQAKAAATLPQELVAAAATADCAAASILAQGIALNIVDQQNEQAAVDQIATILKQNPVDQAAFAVAKQNLLTFVNNGIAIRQMNQLIAPTNNAATAGLAIVANAQLTELGLSTNLTGNPTTDAPIVSTLQTDFAGGIKQNMMNQAAALSGCPATAQNGTLPSNSTKPGAGQSRQLSEEDIMLS